MALDQSSRTLSLATPLGENVLLLNRFDGTEFMSGLFSFQLSMISDDNAIKPKDIVGTNITFTAKLPDDSIRYFNGFVSRFAAGDEDDVGRRDYQAEVVPWLWFLTRTSDCRIFQNMTIPDIIQKIFDDLGFKDYKPQLNGNHPQHEFVVQYQETDFDFVSRLMQAEGIFYFFQHENGKHTLILGDHKGAYVDCTENEVDYPRDIGSQVIAPHITSWRHEFAFRTGKFAQTDYNFKTPSTSLMTKSESVIQIPGMEKFEYYEFPGSYGKKPDGQSLSDMRMESEEAGHDIVIGASICRSFTAGGKFKIGSHRASSEEGKGYVLTQVSHSAAETNLYETGSSSEFEYSNLFTCIPDSAVARPERPMSRPLVKGVQTAVVVGPAGEEIYVDEHGRVKVQFHWDREGKRDENSSCWVRVSQVHAGAGFGGIDIPRIGEEVIVAFEDGNPDRPLITGRVYHAENKPPYPLPGGMNISGLKSRSTKGGGGYNELILDDTKNKELIRMHAQKDLDVTVEHDETRRVVDGKQSVTVKGDTSLTVQVGNRNVEVQTGSYGCGAKKAITLHGHTEGVSIKGDAKGVSITGTGKGVAITGEPSFFAEGKSTATVKSPEVNIGDKVINIGGTDVKIKGTTVEISAGGGAIKIDSAGITISGNLIKASASGIHEITGSLVKIN